MKTIRAIIIFIVLLSVPFVVRIAFFYRGVYQPSPVNRPTISEISLPQTPDLVEFVDSFRETDSVVVFDLAHDNNFKEAELNVLLSRLAARGARPEYLMLGDSLDQKLRGAQGFVVISPRLVFTEDEVRKVKHFVNSGGKLLLVTDPTRYETVYDEMGFPSDRKSD